MATTSTTTAADQRAAGQGVVRALIYRPLLLAALVVGVALGAAALVLVGASWRSVRRFEMAHQHLSRLGTLQQAQLALQGGDAAGTDLARQRLLALQRRGPASDIEQREIDDVLRCLAPGAGHDVGLADRLLGQMFQREQHAVAHLVGPLGLTARTELGVSMALVLTLPLVGLLLLVLMRKRVVLPLRNLARLMGSLARQEYRVIPTGGIDPLIEPIYRSYNQMVERLAELDQHHQQRQVSLREQVRQATRALLDQQQSLARAERLAAVGEVAAGLAHELRNPLAGLQVALTNLHAELSDAAQLERLDLMIAEVKRVVQLLNSSLGQVRVAPAAELSFDLAPAVDELLALVRYQLPERIRLEHRVPADLRSRLPRSRLHQALLNLLLNAAQAIGQDSGRITVQARAEEGALAVSVLDNGPGLPAELLQRGVRPFASWREEGVGLGLAVVRRFVQDLGGELRLANSSAGGAEITMILPGATSSGVPT